MVTYLFSDASGGIFRSPLDGANVGVPKTSPTPTTLVESETFSSVAIRGLAIGPIGCDIEDTVFASTGALSIVAFDPFEPLTFDPTSIGDIFSDPPISRVQNPYRL